MQQRAFLITFCVSGWMPMFMPKIQSSHIICSYNLKLENAVTLGNNSEWSQPVWKTHNYSHNECSQWNLAPGQILIPGHEGKTDFFLQMIANKSSEAVELAKKFLHLLIFCSLPLASNTKIEFNGGWNHFFSHYFTSTYFTGLSLHPLHKNSDFWITKDQNY